MPNRQRVSQCSAVARWPQSRRTRSNSCRFGCAHAAFNYSLVSPPHLLGTGRWCLNAGAVFRHPIAVSGASIRGTRGAVTRPPPFRRTERWRIPATKLAFGSDRWAHCWSIPTEAATSPGHPPGPRRVTRDHRSLARATSIVEPEVWCSHRSQPKVVRRGGGAPQIRHPKSPEESATSSTASNSSTTVARRTGS
jgi:hypothetical protein